MRNAKDCYDVYRWGHTGELCYECMGVGAGANQMLFCACCWPNNNNLLYCSFCNSCHDCFGCAGLRHKSYCIFNRQYSKEEYENIVPTLIESMMKTGEWGEFFPVSLSAYAYNDSIAQEYFPLTKEQVLKRGWRWSDYEAPLPVVQKIIAAVDLPDSIDAIPDDILNWAIECEVTKKLFKIVRQELDFYRQMKLPIPRRHPYQRHKDRMALRNPRKLWDRTCAKCQKTIVTSYAPERPEIVSCEECLRYEKHHSVPCLEG